MPQPSRRARPPIGARRQARKRPSTIPSNGLMVPATPTPRPPTTPVSTPTQIPTPATTPTPATSPTPSPWTNPTPVAGQPCPTWVHDQYRATGPDGKLYATWHPPTDPRYRCTFGHE